MGMALKVGSGQPQLYLAVIWCEGRRMKEGSWIWVLRVML